MSQIDETIVSAAIHPAIGIARVGNSRDEYFIGPEVTAPVKHPAGFYKDATGALKRQRPGSGYMASMLRARLSRN